MDFIKLIAGLLIITAFGVGTFYAVDDYNNDGCQYICDGNGDENAYRYNAGCWCRDEKGLYNPADSRDGRSDRQ